MRCRFCGSKSLHEDTQRKNFSTGKAVAGAVVFGVVGAAAGFIGKDQKGYRCGACGQFMDAPMDFFTEGQIDTAIREAESGRSRTMFDYYHNQYANIQANIPAALPTSASAPAQEIIYQPMIAAPAGTTLKRSYRYGLWEPDCPIWVEGVILKTAEDGDKLSLAAWNLGKETVRSVYFLVKVFDDTGDQVSECRCVYQGLSIPRGGQLPEEKEFSLNTDLAYRVELTCEKAALEGDAVWRQEANAKEHSLPEQPELSEENFPRLKYANPKYSALKTDREHYKMPIQAEGFWLCCCGTPVQDGQQCPRCGDTWEHVELCFSQPYLMERQQKAVRERAAKRATALGSRLESVKRERAEAAEAEETARKNKIYNTAATLQKEKRPASLREAAKEYEKISGWRDADEQAKSCLTLADEIEEKERIEEEERREREAKEAAERKRKTKKIAAIVTPIVIACVAFVIVLTTVIIPNANYNKALALKNSGDYEAAIAAFEAMNGYKDSADQIYECSYEYAVTLKSNGDYVAASAAFEALDGYKDSADQAKECSYEYAVDLKDAGDYEAAIKVFMFLGEYKDSNDQVQECTYSYAVSLKENGDYESAISTFEVLNGYKDSADQIEQIKPLYYKEILSDADVGDYVYFGTYEQDNNTKDGKEDIEWLVLEKNGNRVLLISRYALDAQPYNSSNTNVTWETCSLRTWLNGTFISSAFSAEEQSVILTSTLRADKNPWYDTSAGNNTRDKVFLLSLSEVEQYFSNEYARKCEPTAYAKVQGVKGFDVKGTGRTLELVESDDGNCIWRLRTPGSSQKEVAGIMPDGSMATITGNDYVGAVRPALWIDLGN